MTDALTSEWKAAKVESTRIIMQHALTDDAIRSDINYAVHAAQHEKEGPSWFAHHRHVMELDIKRNALCVVMPLLILAEKRGVAVIDAYLQRTDQPDPGQEVRRQLSQCALAAVRPTLA